MMQLNIWKSLIIMLEEKEFDADIIGEASVFDETYKQINKRNCAILPYKGIKRAL